MIFVSHGVVTRHRADRISHALLLPERDFVAHLKLRAMPYVSLEEAIAGRGDALTVDDATIAGYQQVMLARQYGHAATWFVNGSHVHENIPYFPFLISCLIDDTVNQGCCFRDQWWELDTPIERQAFRFYLKQLYMGFSEQREIQDFLRELAKSLSMKAVIADPVLATASLREIKNSELAGVSLQNHGWSHLNPGALSQSVCHADLVQNAEWLSEIRPGLHNVYAPPFGNEVALPPSAYSVMLLANRKLSRERLSPEVINRADLILRPANQIALQTQSVPGPPWEVALSAIPMESPASVTEPS